MKNKLLSTLIILLIVGFVVLLLFLIFPNQQIQPCDYENHAWGYVKRTCDCIGKKVDTTPQGVTDAGVSYGCIGIATNHTCYTDRGNYSTTQKDKVCSKKYHNK